jgi:hypothetical protein
MSKFSSRWYFGELISLNKRDFAGCKYFCCTDTAILKADTLAGIKKLIKQNKGL